MSLLLARGLRRDFNGKLALHGLDLELGAGAVVGLVGPNGAGKTTTLRLLATVDVPSAGEVIIDDIPAREEPDRARALLGYMPDRYGIYDDVTVFEFLDFFARAHGLTGAERRGRVDAILELGGLRAIAQTRTGELSKGMRQQVALGRTLLHDPKVLLLDEPADGLDPAARIELRELLKALAEEGKAVLVSSHVLSDLEEICHKVAVLVGGQLVAYDHLDALRARLGHETAAVSVRFSGQPSFEILGRARLLLLEQPGVELAEVAGAGVRVRLKQPATAAAGWREEAAADLLQKLVAAGLRVTGVVPEEVGLEDIFLRLTRGE